MRGIVKYNLFPIFTHSRLRGVVGVIYIVPNIYIFRVGGVGNGLFGYLYCFLCLPVLVINTGDMKSPLHFCSGHGNILPIFIFSGLWVGRYGREYTSIFIYAPTVSFFILLLTGLILTGFLGCIFGLGILLLRYGGRVHNILFAIFFHERAGAFPVLLFLCIGWIGSL